MSEAKAEERDRLLEDCADAAREACAPIIEGLVPAVTHFVAYGDEVLRIRVSRHPARDFTEQIP